MKIKLSREEEIVNIVNKVLYGTKDTKKHRGSEQTALTSLLFNICGNNPFLFDEACRLSELFIRETIKVVDAESE